YNIDLTLLTPKTWRHPMRGSMRYQVGRAEPFRTLCCDAIFKGHNLRYFYVGLPWIILKYGKDIVHLEEEPISLVAFLSASWARLFSKRFVFFTWENILRKKELFPYDLFGKAVMRLSHAAVAGNGDALSVLKARGFKTKIVQFGQLGIDVPFDPQTGSADFGKVVQKHCRFRVGFLGRVNREKGVQTLIEAATQTPADIGYVVIGRGDFRGEAESLAHRLGLSERITFIDTLPHETIPDVMKSLDLMVLPSLTTPTWKEQFGQVLIEAMACGVPVVGSNSGAIPEVIGDSGLIFSEGDAQALAKAIMELASDNALRSRLAAKGRQRVNENYTHQIIAAKTAQLYRQILSG
ncbi:MAG: glycosyltransferase, partial [Desulfobacterales bacterium]